MSRRLYYLQAMRFLIVATALALTAPAVASAGAADPGASVGAYLNSCELVVRNPYQDIAGGEACTYYMGGVGDVFTSHFLQPLACSNEGLTTMDVIRTFVSWARRNPEFHREHVFRGVMAALREAYPCPTQR